MNDFLSKIFSKEEKLVEEPIQEQDERLTGKIIHLDEEDGWGFIDSRDIKFTRIFFHWTALLKETLHFSDLQFGMKVEFTPIKVEGKGYRAIKIKVIHD